MSAFMTSYIPTTTTSLTRAADSASMTGTNFSSWWNASEGTFVVGFDTAHKTSAQSAGLIGTSASARFIYKGSGIDDVRSYDGGTILDTANGTVSDPSKAALGYTAGASRSLVLDGDTVATTGTCAAAFTAGTSLLIGTYDHVSYLNGHISRLTYYAKRLPDATLKALTA